MSEPLRFERVAENDPLRCKGVDSTGQCIYKAVEGCEMCPRHGGGRIAAKNKKNQLNNYHLTQYQERVGQLANNSEIKSLREEIGIVRMLLEKQLNNLKTPNELLIYSDKLVNMVGQIQRLIESAQKLEERNNQLLDRKVVIVIADSITAIIGRFVTNPDHLDQIGQEICECIIAAGNGGENLRRVVAESNHAALAVGM